MQVELISLLTSCGVKVDDSSLGEIIETHLSQAAQARYSSLKATLGKPRGVLLLLIASEESHSIEAHHTDSDIMVQLKFRILPILKVLKSGPPCLIWQSRLPWQVHARAGSPATACMTCIIVRELLACSQGSP